MATTITNDASQEAPFINKRNLWLVIACFTLFYLWVRWYQHAYGWSAGLDSFSPEFHRYWMRFLYIACASEIVIAGLLWAYIWRTRDRHLDQQSPRDQLRRHFTHLNWLLAYAITLYWGASFFGEQGATWHKAITRDTDFTPCNIVQFYLSYPLFITVGVGAFLYAKTRLSCFAKAWSLPYLVLVVGPFMLLPCVSLNEWGLTFWWMEELAVAPHQYGFAFFSWTVLAVSGVLLQIFSDLHRLIGGELQVRLQHASSERVARTREGAGV